MNKITGDAFDKIITMYDSEATNLTPSELRDLDQELAEFFESTSDSEEE